MQFHARGKKCLCMTLRFVPPHASPLVTTTRVCPALSPQIHQPLAARARAAPSPPSPAQPKVRARGPSLEQTQHRCVQLTDRRCPGRRGGGATAGRPGKNNSPGTGAFSFFFFFWVVVVVGHLQGTVSVSVMGPRDEHGCRTLSHSSAIPSWQRSYTDTETQRPSCSQRRSVGRNTAPVQPRLKSAGALHHKP